MNDGSALPTLQVYFNCGARVDVVDVQGLILSPGFPYNYSSGTHCVWQFFVPVDYQLILEIFDFDVFESHDSAAQYSALSNFEEEEVPDEEVTFTPGGSLAADEPSLAAKVPVIQSFGDVIKKTQQSSQEGEVKQVVVQEQSTKMEIAKVSNSAKRSAEVSSLPPLPVDKAVNSASSSHLREDFHPSTVMEETTLSSTETPPTSPESQHSILNACPHDVLYITDLITFSSRFCGSNRPPSSQLVFGSSQEMVEVIMELITTTHWGRGFALLFHYHNLTEPGGDRRVDSLLAAVSGAAFFAMLLTSALCLAFRPKLCPKRASSCASSDSEVPEGVPNTAAEVSELQLMAENQTNLEVSAEQDNNNDSPPHTVSAGGDMSQSVEVDLSCSGLTELDLGADEVFIVSSAPSSSRLPFSPHTQRERFLRHSDTGPVGDWTSPDSTISPSGSTREGSNRPRAWSVRTFQDLLPPLPQLHKKWCSWNSGSPFTKLVDSTPTGLAVDGRADQGRRIFSDVHLDSKADSSSISDSTLSNASFPLSLPAQRQRRLNSTSNLWRSRFTGPCFGLLSGTQEPTNPSVVVVPPTQGSPSEPSSASSTQSQTESGKKRDFPGESDHISVQVFAISEEEDRQPLVSAEHLNQTSGPLNGVVKGTYEGKGPSSLSPQRSTVPCSVNNQM
ncbi:CUB and sushi domain containing protein 2 [Dissostichus eleginoides]|uniref:CUB and sushi domain containing protein 2 n=1 Tax=Dissostichus eleginoides TaxID=100907 RepID=A0AAD9C3X2_DISEL|nr:CUB and sushi domain containing protein 2 [Dissostichus eleginoides]